MNKGELAGISRAVAASYFPPSCTCSAVLVTVLVTAMLVDVEDLLVVLNCTSLIANEVKPLFMFLFSVCIFLLGEISRIFVRFT